MAENENSSSQNHIRKSSSSSIDDDRASRVVEKVIDEYDVIDSVLKYHGNNGNNGVKLDSEEKLTSKGNNSHKNNDSKEHFFIEENIVYKDSDSNPEDIIDFTCPNCPERIVSRSISCRFAPADGKRFCVLC